MSLLTRMSAPAAGGELAELVTALLTSTSAGTRPRPGPERAAPAVPDAPLPPPALPTGPTGLGSAAVRITPTNTPPAQRRQRDAASDDVPELYCPPPARDDPALGEEVNERLVAWAEEVGVYAERLDDLRATNFGRLFMLTYAETDDADRLLMAAKVTVAQWAVDDYYTEAESAGPDAPQELAPRLGIAAAALDPAHLPVGYAPALERALRDDPVLVAIRSGMNHLARYAGAAQVARLRHEVAHLHVAFGAEAGWRLGPRTPLVWEYLAHRQYNSFLMCLALIDPVGGYELPAPVYAGADVRRAVTMAASAATLVNDLYSMAKEDRSGDAEFNLPAVIAAEEGCSLREGVVRTAAIHDELVHRFEAEAAALSLAGPPPLGRFLAAVWAWLGGNREWHSTSSRYAEQPRT
jgi:2-methylisoborneol synthase